MEVKMSNKYFCENCRNDMDQYDLFMEPMVINIDGVNYEYVGRTARCIECGSEIYVPEVMDFNLQAIDETKKMVKAINESKKKVKKKAKDNVETLCTNCKNRVICKYYDKVKELTPEFDIPDHPFDVSIRCEFRELNSFFNERK